MQANGGQLRARLPLSRLVHLTPYLRTWFQNTIDSNLNMELQNQRSETKTLDSLEKSLARSVRILPLYLRGGAQSPVQAERSVLYVPCGGAGRRNIRRGEDCYVLGAAETARHLECVLGDRPCVGLASDKPQDTDMVTMEYSLAWVSRRTSCSRTRAARRGRTIFPRAR